MQTPKLTHTTFFALAALLSGQSLAADTHFAVAKIADHKMLLRYENDPSASVLVLLHGFDNGSIEYRTLVAQLDETFTLTLPYPPRSSPDDTAATSREESSPDSILAVIDVLLAGVEGPGVSLLVEGYAGPVGIRLATRDEEEIAKGTYSSKVDFWCPRGTDSSWPVRQLVTKYMID